MDRSGGAVTLNLVAESLGKVQQGTERIAAELALVRLNRILDNLRESNHPLIEIRDVEKEIARNEAILQFPRTPVPNPPPIDKNANTGKTCRHCRSNNVAFDQSKRYVTWCFRCRRAN